MEYEFICGRCSSFCFFRVFTYMETNKKIICQICNLQTNFNSKSFCNGHLRKHHSDYNAKKYYDEYIKKHNEGICLCGNKTRFITFDLGYCIYCSKKCSTNDNKVKNKIRKTKLNKYGNLNNNKKAKKTIQKKYGVDNVSQILFVKQKKKITTKNNYGVENPLQSEEVKKKQKKTLFLRYGVNNISKHPETEKKRKKTTLDRYGVTHYSKSIEFRIYNENNNIWIPNELKTEFELYSRNVWNETKKHKKKLFGCWNGRCYYSDEILNKKINYNKPNYPVIDHKTSIYFGFQNDVNFQIIGNIDNLCVCSRIINNKKGIMCENEFKLNK